MTNNMPPRDGYDVMMRCDYWYEDSVRAYAEQQTAELRKQLDAANRQFKDSVNVAVESIVARQTAELRATLQWVDRWIGDKPMTEITKRIRESFK